MSIFAKRFKQERMKKGLTQKELAIKFNTNKSNISRYENGYSIPKVKSLQNYADFFNVSIDYLLGRTDLRNYNQIPQPLQKLTQKKNLKYLKIAKQIKDKNISPEIISLFITFYEKLKSKTNC